MCTLVLIVCLTIRSKIHFLLIENWSLVRRNVWCLFVTIDPNIYKHKWRIFLSQWMPSRTEIKKFLWFYTDGLEWIWLMNMLFHMSYVSMNACITMLITSFLPINLQRRTASFVVSPLLLKLTLIIFTQMLKEKPVVWFYLY